MSRARAVIEKSPAYIEDATQRRWQADEMAMRDHIEKKRKKEEEDKKKDMSEKGDKKDEKSKKDDKKDDKSDQGDRAAKRHGRA